jgi:hypothetical protein
MIPSMQPLQEQDKAEQEPSDLRARVDGRPCLVFTQSCPCALLSFH